MHYKDINPKNNPAYCNNLYKWLKKHVLSKEMHFYLVKPPNQTQNEIFTSLYVGVINECGCCPSVFTGAKVSSIINNQHRIHSCMTYSNMQFLTLAEQIEQNYLKIGKCALDPSHNIWTENRYKSNDSVRECLWCGQKQIKMFDKKTIEVVEVYSYWENEKQLCLPFLNV